VLLDLGQDGPVTDDILELQRAFDDAELLAGTGQLGDRPLRAAQPCVLARTRDGPGGPAKPDLGRPAGRVAACRNPVQHPRRGLMAAGELASAAR